MTHPTLAWMYSGRSQKKWRNVQDVLSIFRTIPGCIVLFGACSLHWIKYCCYSEWEFSRRRWKKGRRILSENVSAVERHEGKGRLHLQSHTKILFQGITCILYILCNIEIYFLLYIIILCFSCRKKMRFYHRNYARKHEHCFYKGVLDNYSIITSSRRFGFCWISTIVHLYRETNS